MNATIKETLKKYENFDDTYKYAYVGFPKGFAGIEKAFYGTFYEFNKQYPNIKADKTYPTLMYMHGSSGLKGGEVYREYIVEECGFIFFAPNSFKIKNRPTYKSPANASDYTRVHKVRVAEIEYNLKKIEELSFFDIKNIFLMGNSEGGLATAIFESEKFAGRIVTAFSCEDSYFYKDFKLGSKIDEPFLNIMGTHDEFFAKGTTLNKEYKVKGHGMEKLKNHENAKVVILSKTKHELTSNRYVKEEILSFLKLWRRG